MKTQERRTKAIVRDLTTLAFVTVLFGWLGSTHGQSSASYEIARSVFSAGGGWSSSASYELTGTLGQASPVNVSESDSYNLGSGFWGGMVRMFSVAIQSISYSVAEGVRITWQSIADASYTVYYADALSLSTVWNALSTLTGTGGLMEWLDDGSETRSSPTGADVLRRFYRLRGQP